jgi:hypothetical protein
VPIVPDTGAQEEVAHYVIGEVVLFHVAESLLTGLRVDSASIDAIARLGGPNYTRVTKESVFAMPRPVLPPK